MLTLYYNKDRVAALIADAVIQSDGQDEIAELLCNAYTEYQAGGGVVALLAMFTRINAMLQRVEQVGEA